jgi:hypothetical protein
MGRRAAVVGRREEISATSYVLRDVRCVDIPPAA